MAKRQNILMISGMAAILFIGYGLIKEKEVHDSIRSIELHKIEIDHLYEKEKAKSVQTDREATIKDWDHLFDKIETHFNA